MTVAPAVAVENLCVRLSSGADIVDEVSFAIGPGRVLGLVGESGSGKTTVAQALLGFARRGARIAGGSVRIADRDVLACTPDELRAVRGGVVAYIPQDPTAALSPTLRIGGQLEDVLKVHTPQLDADARRELMLDALEDVSLPRERAFLRRYPHELSGGQLQRVAIAMAFLPRPPLIVADEPTTGLDVTTQARVLETIHELSRRHGVALLYVSHDLAVVSEVAEDVAVMYAGRVVEQGPGTMIFGAPRHPYTRGLLRAAPRMDAGRALVGIPGGAPAPGTRPPGCAFAARCPSAIDRCREAFPGVNTVDGRHQVRCWRAEELPAVGLGRAHGRPRADAPDLVLRARSIVAAHGSTTVLHGVDLEVGRGECLALVGESGSGKTTLAKCLVGLHRDFTGTVELDGELLAPAARRRTRKQRRRLQYIFQSPYASLNPRRTIGLMLARQVQLLHAVGSREGGRRALELLERVALAPAVAARYPDELSGGERQRAAIARALAADPSVLVCDEITSALDVSVQAAIVRLLEDLREREGLALVFVTHNLALIRSIADRVSVMSAGRIVETGSAEAVLDAPTDPYTRRLLANTPVIATPTGETVPPR